MIPLKVRFSTKNGFQILTIGKNLITDDNCRLLEAGNFDLWTGCKDRNGVEIFSNDIVKSDPNHIAAMTDAFQFYRGIVTWMSGGFHICQEGLGRENFDRYVACQCPDCPCGLEVVGHAYADIKE